MFINLARVLKNGWKNFSRNIWLSVATLFMMFVALAVVGGLFLFNASLDTFVAGLEDKVDVSVYFKQDADEDDIEDIKQELEQRSEVKEVRYVSRDDALAVFTDRHSDNDVLLESLDELDENPLQASLNIKVHNTDQFAGVVASIESSGSASLIDNINFQENQKVIQSISEISANLTRAGFMVTSILVALVVFVTLNTIRLAIYTARDEIYIMKLVGASNWFVRLPFVITGGMFGLLAGGIVVGASFLGTNILNSQVSLIFADLNMLGYLVENWVIYTAGVVGGGVVLGTVSSWLAVRRYLHV